MKKAILILSFVCVAAAQGQVQSLVQGDEWAAWIKPEAKLTKIGDDTAGLAGLQLGPSLNRNLYLGAAWYGLISSAKFSGDYDSGKIKALDFWYAGGVVGYTFLPERLVHGSVDLLIGGGRVNGDLDSGGSENANLFVLEPTANVMINLAPDIEFGLGVGYRYVNGSDIDALSNSDLRNFTGCLFFRWTE